MKRIGSVKMIIQRGFTLIEMVISLIIIAVISAVIMPNLDHFFSPSADASREAVLGALRQAKNHAYSHRRLVCVTASGSSITMLQASTNPAASCGGTSLKGPDGSSNFLNDMTGVVISSTPSSTLYFQPDGTLSSDAAGSSISNYVLTVTTGTQTSVTVTISGASASPQ